MTTSTDYTIDELISVCICRQIVNGEVIGQGIATPLVMAGVLLAKLTHAPDLWFASAVGGTLCRDWSPLGLTSIEKPWLDHGLALLSFPRITCEFLPRFNVREFFRPAQVDACGNFNNVFIGSDYASPADAPARQRRHSRCDDLRSARDVVCAAPFARRLCRADRFHQRPGACHPTDRLAAARSIASPIWASSILRKGVMRLTSYHPGQSIEKIQAKTGFHLEVAPDVHETEPPTEEEVRLLREEIDPLGVRKLETLSGAQRKELIREILKKEA